MALQVQPIAAASRPMSTPSQAASFDERWAAWQAKGVAHERAVRRKMALAAPIAVAIIIVIVYAFSGR